MPDLESFILLEEAARRYGLHVRLLNQLVEKGDIRAAMIDHKIVVAESEIVAFVQKTVRDGKKYTALEGKPIRATKAAEKYQIPQGTLSRWAKRGYIRVIERGPKLLLLNEADVARAKDLAEHLGMRGGRGVIGGPVYSIECG